MGTVVVILYVWENVEGHLRIVFDWVLVVAIWCVTFTLPMRSIMLPCLGKGSCPDPGAVSPWLVWTLV